MTTFKRHNGTNWEYIGLPNNVGLSPQTLAYAEIVADQVGVGTTTEANIAGLNGSIVVPAGRRIRVTAYCLLFGASTTLRTDIRLKMDGVEIQRGEHFCTTTTGSSVSISRVISPSEGSHSFTVTIQTSTGTVSVGQGAVRPGYVLIEDITGSTLPYNPSSIPVGTAAYAQRTSNQTGIGTTPTLIGGLQVNVSVPAGRQLKITGFLPTFTKTSGAPTWVRAYIRRDGVDIQRTIESATNDVFTALTVEIAESPTAGAHVYEILVDTDTGTVALDLGSIGTGATAFILVEDITPTPAAGIGAPGSTLAYIENTALNQTPITSQVAVNGLSVNVNVPAGRRLKITGKLHVNNSSPAADRHLIQIVEGVTQLQGAYGNITNAALGEDFWIETIITPSAGSHTYFLTLGRANGDGNLTAFGDATLPAFILVEDVTGAVWPLGVPVTAGLFASEVWTTYSPTITQSVNVTKTDTYSRYMKLGRTVHFEFQLTITGSGTGANSVLISLPFLPVGQNQLAGTGEIINVSTGLAHRGLAKVLTSGSVFFIPTDSTVNNVLGVTGFTEGLAVGDVVSGSITYEAVS